MTVEEFWQRYTAWEQWPVCAHGKCQLPATVRDGGVHAQDWCWWHGVSQRKGDDVAWIVGAQ